MFRRVEGWRGAAALGGTDDGLKVWKEGPLSGFKSRLAVHALSWGVAIPIAFTDIFRNGIAQTYGDLLSPFIGLICLASRGDPRKPEWRVPFGLGIAAALAAIPLGIPWQIAIFFGGALSWLIRCLFTRGRFGWDWSVSPWLFILFIYNTSRLSDMVTSPVLALAFPAAAVAGYFLGRAMISALHARSRRRGFDRALAALAKASVDNRLEDETRSASGTLCRLADTGISLFNFKSGTDSLVIRATRAGGLVEGVAAAGSYGREMERRALAEVSGLNSDLIELMMEKGLLGEDIAKLQDFAKRIDEYADMLPAAMADDARAISRVARKSIERMVESPLEPATPSPVFDRFRKPLLGILEKYVKLTGLDKSAAAERGDCAQALSRIRGALETEGARTRHEDSAELKAELRALDTLLKMHGH